MFGFGSVLAGTCPFKVSTTGRFRCCADFEHINLAIIM